MTRALGSGVARESGGARKARRWSERNEDGGLASRVLGDLRRSFDASCVVDRLVEATDGEAYLFGGTLRRGLFGDAHSGDLDVMVPNGDNRIFRALRKLGVPFVLNRQRHHRYRWNRQQIDVLQPREFYAGFPTIEGALGFFDLRVNALALHLASRRILDPFGITSSRMPPSDVGINWRRWCAMPDVELAILAIRLLRIVHETPGSAVGRADALRLQREVLPRLQGCDWRPVHQRFPLGKSAFMDVFVRNVVKSAEGRWTGDL